MSKEIMIARTIGEYDGKKQMLLLASEEMFRNIPRNEDGEVSAEAVLLLNEWVERMKERIQKGLTNELIRIDRM